MLDEKWRPILKKQTRRHFEHMPLCVLNFKINAVNKLDLTIIT